MADVVDVFEHLMIKLIDLVFEELAYLATRQIDLVLVLQATLLYLVE
jgi:hypothetical protein